MLPRAANARARKVRGRRTRHIQQRVRAAYGSREELVQENAAWSAVRNRSTIQIRVPAQRKVTVGTGGASRPPLPGLPRGAVLLIGVGGFASANAGVAARISGKVQIKEVPA